MIFREIDAFDVVHGQLGWPWIAFSADGKSLAHASSATSIATRMLDRDHVVAGPSFTLPPDLGLGLAMSRMGLTAFALSSSSLLAIAGLAGGVWTIATVDATGERKRVPVDALLGEGHEVMAIAFDRRDGRLWLSAETPTETVIALVDAASLALVGQHRSAALPRPAVHELHLHPSDDAVLLVAACGEEGSFARVVGYAGDVVSAVPTTLDAGGVAAGFVGFSADAARVHLAEADELRTHAWPTLNELSSVPFDDEFVSSFSGAVLGTDILVDGENTDTGEDAIMLFDRSAVRGVLARTLAPSGMWAGRLGREAVVTVASKGDPVRARVLVRSGVGAAGDRLPLMS